MKFAFSTNAFRKFSFSEAAEAIAGAGYSGIEIMCDTPHAYPDELSENDIENIKQTLTKNNLEISNLNAFMMHAVTDIHHPSWIEVDKEYRQIRIQHTKNCIDLAARLGAKTISTEPGGPLKDIPKGMPKQEALEIFADGLASILPHAMDKGIMVLIEPEPDLLIQTSDEFLAFIEMFNHPNLWLNLDIGHFYCVGEDPVEIISKLKNYTRHYHLEDIPTTREHKHIIPGQGGIDIPGALKAVEKTGYDGFITLELYPYLDDPHKTARDAMQYLEQTYHP